MDTADIPVVILCGGMGTRLREASEKLPKPLVDIGGKPILWHIMKLYGSHGYRRFVLCLGYKSELIKRYFLDYRAEFRISPCIWPTVTGGCSIIPTERKTGTSPSPRRVS